MQSSKGKFQFERIRKNALQSTSHFKRQNTSKATLLERMETTRTALLIRRFHWLETDRIREAFGRY